MNIYFHIDPSWSYQFLTRHKKNIAVYDFFTFSDRLITVAANVLTAHVNYGFYKDPKPYSVVMEQVSKMCDDYPDLGAELQRAFIDLQRTHQTALAAIPGPIVNHHPIIDDMYIFTGMVFTL